MDNKRAITSHSLIFFLGSLIFYWIFNIPFVYLCIVLSVLILAILIAFKKIRLVDFFKITLAIGLNITAYIVARCVHDKMAYGVTIQEWLCRVFSLRNIILAIVPTVFIIALFIQRSFYMRHKNKAKIVKDGEKKTEPAGGFKPCTDGTSRIELFPQQKEDIARIKEHIKDNRIRSISIQGELGTGKTTMLRKVAEELEATGKYLFVTIDLLTCTLDEVQPVVISRLSSTLRQHHIFSSSGGRIKTFLSEAGTVGLQRNISSLLSSFLWDSNYSYAESLSSFKKDLALLDKTIVIAFDDIDRIPDTKKDVVGKIFSIGEALSSTNNGGATVKCIYLYWGNGLASLGYDRNYTEKYVDELVDVTSLDFISILREIYAREYGDEQLIDFSEDKDSTYFSDNVPIDKNLVEILKIPEDALYSRGGSVDFINLGIRRSPIRKVKRFINQVHDCFKQNPDYLSNSDTKFAAITFFIVKNFFFEMYEKIEEKSLLSTHFFSDGDRNFSLEQLLAVHQDCCASPDATDDERHEIKALTKKIFADSENLKYLGLINKFGYKANVYIDLEDYSSKLPVEQKDKIDQLVRHLRWRGRSPVTSQEAYFTHLFNAILIGTLDEQVNNFDYLIKLHKAPGGYGTTSMFIMGVDDFIQIFSNFCLVYGDQKKADDLLSRLVEFYFHYEYFRDGQKQRIDVKLIYRLAELDPCGDLSLMAVVRNFNKLEPTGHFDDYDTIYYEHFLSKFIEKMMFSVGIGGISLPKYNTPSTASRRDAALSMLQDSKDKIEAMVIPSTTKSTPADLDDLQQCLKFICLNKKIIESCSASDTEMPRGFDLALERYKNSKPSRER